MATLYVKNTGSGTAPYDTWAKAATTLATAAAAAAAGDTIYVSQAHTESQASAMTIASTGTFASPCRILCGNDAAEPPTSLATGASVTTTGQNAITITGSFYMYGIQFNNGTGASNASMTVNNSGNDTVQVYDNCNFFIPITHASSVLTVGSIGIANCRTTFKSCVFKGSNASWKMDISGGGDVAVIGGNFDATHTANTGGLFKLTGNRQAGTLTVDGFDFTNAGSAAPLTNWATTVPFNAVFRNCKLPASWTGTLTTGTARGEPCRVEAWNCASDVGSGVNNFSMWVEQPIGSIKHNTGIYRNGGASDGDTPISWKMTTSADADYPTIILRSPDIYVPNTTTGAAKTLTVEIARDGSATPYTDAEVWLEVQYLGTDLSAKSTLASDAKSNILASAANQTSSSETWTGLGGTNNKMKLAVSSITPNEEGVFICTVCVAKASVTDLYIDPLVTVS